MIRLHIEHEVRHFDAWKNAFDSDPVGRQKLGVRYYQILQSVDNPNYVMIDLDFENVNQAEALVAAMQPVWNRVGAILIDAPQWRIAEAVEAKYY